MPCNCIKCNCCKGASIFNAVNRLNALACVLDEVGNGKLDPSTTGVFGNFNASSREIGCDGILLSGAIALNGDTEPLAVGSTDAPSNLLPIAAANEFISFSFCNARANGACLACLSGSAQVEGCIVGNVPSVLGSYSALAFNLRLVAQEFDCTV